MIIKNIAITGFNKGIGKNLASLYADKHVMGYENINKIDINRIITETEDVEVFVNYEYNDDLHLEITREWYHSHQNKKHILINIMCSDTAVDYQKYFQIKKDLNEYSWDINLAQKDCLCILISPGLADTKIGVDRSDRFVENYSTELITTITKLVDWSIEKF